MPKNKSLAKFACAHNKLDDTIFLADLVSKIGENLTFLDISDNNFFPPQTLDFLRNFTKLEELYIENSNGERKKKVISKRLDRRRKNFLNYFGDEKKELEKEMYNRFYGSLKHLKGMKDL